MCTGDARHRDSQRDQRVACLCQSALLLPRAVGLSLLSQPLPTVEGRPDRGITVIRYCRCFILTIIAAFGGPRKFYIIFK